jgi:multidrug efflux pump subunit AcrA (membrane-fusion protein)
VGKVVATLSDTSQLQLNVKVAEVDIPRITLGQEAAIAIDAIRGRSFAGVVESIAPINQSDKDVVNYPVTIRLTDTALEGVKPGMNAVATLGSAQSLSSGWLVPASALRQQADGQVVVLVMRGDTFAPVVVEPGEDQGEWTLVQSAELQAGDRVRGSVASYVEEQAVPGAGG